LSDGKDLEPAQTLSCVNHDRKIVPLVSRHRIFKVDLKALQLGFGLLLLVFLFLLGLFLPFLLSLQLAFPLSELRFEIVHRGRLNALAQRVVPVRDDLLVLALVGLPWFKDKHFAVETWVWVRSQEVLARELFNQSFLHHSDEARLRDLELESFRNGVSSRLKLVKCHVETGFVLRVLQTGFLSVATVSHRIAINRVLRVRSIQLAASLASRALLDRLLDLVLALLIRRLVRVSFVGRGAVNVSNIGFLEVVKSHVPLLLFLLPQQCLAFLHLNLVNNVQCAPVAPLEVGPPEVEQTALLLDGLEEAIADDGDDFLLLDLLQVAFNFLRNRQAVLPLPHELLNFLDVVRGAVFLVLLRHLDACAAVIRTDVFDEIRAVANDLALQCEDEGARSLIKAVGTTHLF